MLAVVRAGLQHRMQLAAAGSNLGTLPRPASSKRRRLSKRVMAGPHAVVATVDMTVSAQDQAVLDTLRGVVEGNGLATVVRVAGGWVRDKLIGRPNHDLDITLDDMSGEAFARKVHAHLTAAGEAATRVAVIQANPEQSKHLETATTRVHGKDVDFVNLRSEEYTSDSRIPTIEFGTPLDDARRRDFTVNSMFYNVNDGVIEDYTGRGYADLHAGLIRTPLDPRVTLLDDPLRALRAVRFASRYAFALVPPLLQCMGSEEVHEALASKVSRERIGSELEGMLLSDRPAGALRMLAQVDLLPIVLMPPALATAAELRACVSGDAGKKQKAGKGLAVATALARYPYTAPAGTDATPLPALLKDGMAVVDALEGVFAFLSEHPATPLVVHSVLEGGEPAGGAAPPTAAPAAAAGQGGSATPLTIPVGGVKRAAEASPVAEDILVPSIRVVVPRSTGGRAGEVPGPNPHAAEWEARQMGEASPQAVAAAEQLQTARDATAAGCALPRSHQLPLYLAAATWPLRGFMSLPMAVGGKVVRPVSVVGSLVKVHLKRAARVADSVETVQETAEALLPLVKAAAGGAGVGEEGRLPLALAAHGAKDMWLAGLHLAVAVAAGESGGVGEAAAVAGGHAVLGAAVAWRLHRAWTVKPALNGKDLMGMGASRGAGLAPLIQGLLHWQLLHPDAGAEEAKEAALGLIADAATAARK